MNTTRKSRSDDSRFNIIIPANINPRPDKFEELIAMILAQKFQSDISFVPRRTLHTPDIYVMKDKKYWEIKNIRGNGKKTIEDNLRKASRQSENIIISLLRAKMTPGHASSGIRHFLSHARGNVKYVILVTKTGKTIDFRAH